MDERALSPASATDDHQKDIGVLDRPFPPTLKCFGLTQRPEGQGWENSRECSFHI
jgi:hypothetical protein